MSNEKYTLVEQPRHESISENEIRITSDGKIRNYITYAVSKLKEDKTDEIVLKAMGQAISRAVQVAEIVKRRVEGIHSDTTIVSSEIKEKWIPKEDGLDVRETSRQVSSISIHLSKKPQNINSIGYQKPLPSSEVQPDRPKGNNDNRGYGGGGRRYGGGGGYGGGRYRDRDDEEYENRGYGGGGYGGGGRRYGGGGGGYGGRRGYGGGGGGYGGGGRRYGGGGGGYGGRREGEGSGGYGGRREGEGEGEENQDNENRGYGGGGRRYGGGGGYGGGRRDGGNQGGRRQYYY